MNKENKKLTKEQKAALIKMMERAALAISANRIELRLGKI